MRKKIKVLLPLIAAIISLIYSCKETERSETFKLGTGHTVSLPMDRGEGQNW